MNPALTTNQGLIAPITSLNSRSQVLRCSPARKGITEVASPDLAALANIPALGFSVMTCEISILL
jgi:hypothetical protein